MRSFPRIGICITSLGATDGELAELKKLIANSSALKNVTIYGNIRANNIFDSRPVSDRLESLVRAAKNSDIVVAWNGGFNAIELLPQIESLKINPDTIFVGYSDNTILVNALPAKGIARGWMGPSARNWVANPELIDFWLGGLVDLYAQDYAKVSRAYNKLGSKVFYQGKMRGKVLGGNNYTFDLLQGTDFCPAFSEPFILLLEGEDFVVAKDRIWQDFIRNLDSVMLQPGALDNLQGLLIGKFPDSYKPNYKEIEESLIQRKYLQKLPIAYDFPRGYATPSLYLPIGEQMEVVLGWDNTVSLGRL